MNSNIITKINILPIELVNIIKDFLPVKSFIYTNRENYIKYHSIIQSTIKNYDSYIRDIIQRDNHFIFEINVKENYVSWFNIKKYIYNNKIYKNFIYFIIDYCIEQKSNNCRKFITFFLKELGLCKNQHKKNIVKNIIWKN